ncbi:type II toxin-antitoxin system RelE/ParE family toxin [Agrobacterium sp. lyk4-40-TYG-31]|uniref:type II toxin-antitoxin system RelE/ParE family toxin n=1 Tax=Agrobacterium sp. lyk4-40-TYG-31 TaxID=3040276 RepID=UPI000DDA1AB2|nr:type II toxin-antitoxin system RelE/ParE family toxin [Agrobacterium sp. lyk4-40-TYG-31]
MKRYDVRLSPEAETDLVDIYRYVSAASQSQTMARQYLDRITSYLSSFEVFPERGSLRNDIRQGLRVVGFERTISVAFIVEDGSVIILRVAQNGQQLNLSDTRQ